MNNLEAIYIFSVFRRTWSLDKTTTVVFFFVHKNLCTVCSLWESAWVNSVMSLLNCIATANEIDVYLFVCLLSVSFYFILFFLCSFFLFLYVLVSAGPKFRKMIIIINCVVDSIWNKQEQHDCVLIMNRFHQTLTETTKGISFVDNQTTCTQFHCIVEIPSKIPY